MMIALLVGPGAEKFRQKLLDLSYYRQVISRWLGDGDKEKFPDPDEVRYG